MRDCRDRLIRDGHGLAGYTTSAIAADIADLRRVLDIGSWNLYGVSYGTQIALTVMRDHPEGLRSVILDSAIPLQTPWYGTYWSLVWSAMERMFDACADNPRCHELYPDLRADYAKLIDELNDNPIVVTRPHPLSGEPVTIPISGSLLGETMIMLLGFNRWDTAVSTMARLRLHDQGAAEFIGDVAMWFIFQAVSEGQYFAVVCQDENPLADPEGITADLASYTKLAGATVTASYEQICRDWLFDVSPDAERAPVKSAIPTLILSGEFDPMTPPILARTVHADLENSYLFEFPDQGHGLAFLTRCAPQVMSAFLDDPGQRPDKFCLKWRSEPQFFSAP
jgi:pimeloyl-ACP methyl ester carboxylesterase